MRTFGWRALSLLAGLGVLIAATGSPSRAAQPQKAPPKHAPSRPDHPQYTDGNQLLRPANYREWVYLSSGLGMTYGGEAGAPQTFTNVFVPAWAYRKFLESGRWPDQTMFVVEERSSETKGSINKSGHFQTELVGIGVEVKDEARFPEKWAYYTFGAGRTSARETPKETCWQCHEDHAAVEHSFVQFYPTLQPVARKFGTYREPK